MDLIWSEEALDRLAEIQGYVARDNPVAAARLIARLIERANALLDHPRMGRVVPEHGRADLREIIEGNYRIVYLLNDRAVIVVTAFESHHRIPDLDIGHEPR